MEARKEIRMHRRDAERIKAAAAATGLQEADFVRQAALPHAREVEQRMSIAILPIATLESFKAAVEAPDKVVPGLAATAGSVPGILKDAR